MIVGGLATFGAMVVALVKDGFATLGIGVIPRMIDMFTKFGYKGATFAWGFATLRRKIVPRISGRFASLGSKAATFFVVGIATFRCGIFTFIREFT